MLSNETKINAIIMYYTLKLNGVIGNKRIQLLTTTFNIHIHTLYNWILLFIKTNIELFEFVKTITITNICELRNKLKDSIKSYYLNNPKYSKYSNKKITTDIEKYVISSIISNNKMTVKTIRKNIKTIYLVEISKQSIYAIFHKNNLTNKKIIVKTNPNSIEKQNEQRIEVVNKLKNVQINNIISIDEMSFNLSSEPVKGWSLKGKKCIVKKIKKNVRGRRFSIIMAVSNSKIIDYSIVEGSITTLKFTNFIKKITKKYPEKHLFMDNCIIHKSKQMFNLIKSNNLNVVFNVPYHSECNPIEYVFSLLRKHLNNNANDTPENLHELLKQFKLLNNSNKFENIFKKCMAELQTEFN